uniref:Uncharacterized protein n=1 Tax=Rhizophora mucronata TaxID=61149 RepID=A0A2P2QN89_RHIMU
MICSDNSKQWILNAFSYAKCSVAIMNTK